MRSVTKEEVEYINKDMWNNKSWGPDGFTTKFYKACFPFSGDENVALFKEACTRWHIWLGLNVTFLTLIPKMYEGDIPSGYWPIELCN